LYNFVAQIYLLFLKLKMKETSVRIFNSVKEALPKAKKTALWILKFMLPISLLVGLLQQTPFFEWLSVYISPIFRFIGLSGETSIVFVSSIFLPLYTPIAIIATLSLDMRQIIILGSICLISHNVLFETAVQKKTGSSPLKIVFLRFFMSFLTAYVLNLILPRTGFGVPSLASSHQTFDTVWSFLLDWAKKSSYLTLKVFLIISGLIVLQNILKEFKVIDWLSKAIAPVMKLMGLTGDSAFLWVIGQTLGLSYGSGILMEEIKNGSINKDEAKALNYHLAVNHSQIEDTMIFVAIGAPYLWMALPRFIGAILVLWFMKAWHWIKPKLFGKNLAN
jgi:hypothetical protein